jgi:hypothetical protein
MPIDTKYVKYFLILFIYYIVLCKWQATLPHNSLNIDKFRSGRMHKVNLLLFVAKWTSLKLKTRPY